MIRPLVARVIWLLCAPLVSALLARGSRLQRRFLGLLVEASYRWPMATLRPLSPPEEALWRAILRINKVLARHLDTDLIQGAGLTASEYIQLMSLSGAPKPGLRMSELAHAARLLASRATRLLHGPSAR